MHDLKKQQFTFWKHFLFGCLIKLKSVGTVLSNHCFSYANFIETMPIYTCSRLLPDYLAKYIWFQLESSETNVQDCKLNATKKIKDKIHRSKTYLLFRSSPVLLKCLPPFLAWFIVLLLLGCAGTGLTTCE